ncbi:MAG: sulfatase-like hydrolase/transferase [Planctomycetia bacterium]|nr:sulfatase-like hydrolase/transferase [Planctomycetia bacterium]
MSPASSNAGAPASGTSATVLARPSILQNLRATVRELTAFCFREKHWFACMFIFVLVWTIELYVVQAITLVYPNDTGAKFAFWAPKIRFLLDVLFISALTAWLRRRWLLPLVTGSFFIYLGLITYHQYFLRPLSLSTILSTWREGLVVGGFALDLFPRRAALFLVLALAAQIAALVLSRKVSLPRRCAWLGGGVLTALYAGVYLIANHFDPLEYIQTTRGVGRVGEIRGYLGPWFAEWYYLRDDQVLQQAIERRKVRYDRLTPREANIPIRKHLAIVQAESFDFNILDYRANGQEVTPFLNRLREMSMFYRVQAVHSNGSSDADFVALNGVIGSTHKNTYKIHGYPYGDKSPTTPQLLARCGYATYSFHGNSGEFYDRRTAYEKIGFEQFYFREELESQFGLKGDRWGIHDKEVLTRSAQMLRTATTPTCHFVITLTTHFPYTLLARHETEIFPDARNTYQNYMNNMRYLDNCLRDYIIALGSGTTVMIYADHPTEDGYEDFTPDRDRAGAREFIPCFIYDTDEELSKIQQTRSDPIATDGSLNLADMINYLRGQMMRSCKPAEAAPAGQ